MRTSEVGVVVSGSLLYPSELLKSLRKLAHDLPFPLGACGLWELSHLLSPDGVGTAVLLCVCTLSPKMGCSQTFLISHCYSFLQETLFKTTLRWRESGLSPTAALGTHRPFLDLVGKTSSTEPIGKF